MRPDRTSTVSVNWRVGSCCALCLMPSLDQSLNELHCCVQAKVLGYKSLPWAATEARQSNEAGSGSKFVFWNSAGFCRLRHINFTHSFKCFHIALSWMKATVIVRGLQGWLPHSCYQEHKRTRQGHLTHTSGHRQAAPTAPC